MIVATNAGRDQRDLDVHRQQAVRRHRQRPAVPAASANGGWWKVPAIDVGYSSGALEPAAAACYRASRRVHVAALLFGLFARRASPPTMQVLIDPNDLRVVDNVLRGQNQLTETHITQVENQVRVLMSNNVAKRVVDRCISTAIRTSRGTGSSIFDPRRRSRALLGAAAAGSDPRARGAATRSSVRSKRVDRTYVVDASVWADRSARSVEIANALLATRSWRNSRPVAPRRRAASPRSLNAPARRIARAGAAGRAAGRRLQEVPTAAVVERHAGERAPAHRAQQPAHACAHPHRRGEGALRQDLRGAAQSRRPGAIGEAVGSATITGAAHASLARSRAGKARSTPPSANAIRP